jgi:DNA helicase-2/ATP-dependent DNA helicase PcrA
MIDFPRELNAEQLDVVLHGDGPCLVLAGAGSGKTRTITYRVAYLLEQGVAPDEILLVTFTNKAAREMNERIRGLIGSDTRLGWSGTFHHIGFRLLRLYAPLLGYKNNFTILDSEDSVSLMKRCLVQEGVDRKERRFPSASVLHSIVSFARNTENTIENVLDMKHPKWLDLAPTITRIAVDYDRRKREANAMDFDDLLVNTYLLLLKSEKIRQKYATQFRYVLVDEYQDTNHIQASIIRALASVHGNILVVGDDAQSIYSFRGANIENILSFEKSYSGAKICKLVTNYRSTPEILQVANDSIANNRAQYHKELKAVKESLSKPEIHGFADSQEEATFIAGRILELRDEGVPLKNIAVLFRAAFHSQSLELELSKRDIPYDYRGGVRFFERAHVKDVLAYLRIMHNTDDTIAWARVLNMQIGIGPAAAEKIIDAVHAEPPSDAAALQHIGSLLPARGQKGWGDFLRIYERLVSTVNGTPTELIDTLIDSKYAEYLENEYSDYRDRLQDIEQLARFAERYHVDDDESGQALQQFLAEATLQESFSARQANRASADDDERIVLSTIHQAKGLEWEVVFIMNVSAGQFPSDRSLTEREGVEEERRLFYVAVTRAQKQLYISYPLMGGFNTLLSGPSLFIQELNRDLVHEEDVFGGTSSVFTDPSDVGDGITYVAEDEPFGSPRQRPASFLKSIDDL